ncbi:MAG: polyhydroxyalkanoic acid synthase [Dokdonella sp.]|nr:MAG: polyhydroxyalkanoic acid synthase [Dokdonella sp.]
MAVIDITRVHGGTIKATKAAINEVANSLGAEYGVSHEWAGNTLYFERSGINGSIEVSKAQLHVYAELGFLMGALKYTIEREIERLLDEHLGR